MVGEIGDWGGLETDGRCTDSHDRLVSVGDIVRLLGGRTLSEDRGWRMASMKVRGAYIVESAQPTSRIAKGRCGGNRR